ncbi:MAG: hypothetical protein R3336_10065, partial [Phycisphaeraceae bacterium]|nr:hypothetical protein [Phycisphaeraceae bacterium]
MAILSILRYRLEQLFVGGAHLRLLVVAAVIGLISLVGGVLVAPATDMTLSEAIWWAFLRLTDPGYLGDDEGAWRRLISTLLTVLGYVVFLGALVAILTQWLHATIERLEAGTTPLRRQGHLAIIGDSRRSPVIVDQLLRSPGRMSRFLARHGRRRLCLTVLASPPAVETTRTLKAQITPGVDTSPLVVRSGSSLYRDQLQRVDPMNASVILLPAPDGDADDEASPDSRTLKTLMSLNRLPGPRGGQARPRIVVELQQPGSREIAEELYQGSVEPIHGDQLISRIIVQAIRRPGLLAVCDELFT